MLFSKQLPHRSLLQRRRGRAGPRGAKALDPRGAARWYRRQAGEDSVRVATRAGLVVVSCLFLFFFFRIIMTRVSLMSVAIFFVHRGVFWFFVWSFRFIASYPFCCCYMSRMAKRCKLGSFFIVLSQGMHALEGGSKVGQWSISL